jgi:hypothetical protein
MSTGLIRITKREWLALGGLTNPKLSRRYVGRKGAGRWAYFKEAQQ